MVCSERARLNAPDIEVRLHPELPSTMSLAPSARSSLQRGAAVLPARPPLAALQCFVRLGVFHVERPEGEWRLTAPPSESPFAASHGLQEATNGSSQTTPVGAGGTPSGRPATD